jgi:hypothetical protein
MLMTEITAPPTRAAEEQIVTLILEILETETEIELNLPGREES